MRTNLVLALLGVFWAGMNVLLWRAEFGRHTLFAGDVPVEVVWQKILTAQDSSPLEIRQRGRRIGFCRWTTTVEEAPPTEPSGAGPEGLVRRLVGYKVELEGNAALGGLPDRLRFDAEAKFDANHNLTRVRVRLGLLSAGFEILANAPDESVQLSFDDGSGRLTTRTFKFAQLRNPALLGEQLFGSDLSEPSLLGMLLPGLDNARALAAQFTCRAENDWLRIGQATIRAYKVEVQLPNRRKAVVYVSRVGEILRVELPGELRLTNQQLIPM